VRTARVTRVADFGAFVELEPGVEGLAHASTFPPSRRREDWAGELAAGKSVVVEIVTIDLERKRIGVAFVPEGSVRAREVEGAEARDGGGAEPAGPGQGLGSLADKLRGALEPRRK
jgi:predicted RNA-binding protein with RPS1 domain